MKKILLFISLFFITTPGFCFCLLIDNFENDHSIDTQPGATDCQVIVYESSSLTITAFANNGATFPSVNDGWYAYLALTKTAADYSYLEFAMLDAPGAQTDFSNVSKLNLCVYTDLPGARILLKFRDVNNNESSDAYNNLLASSNTWLKLSVPLSTLDWSACDPKHIKSIEFFPYPGTVGANVFRVDNLMEITKDYPSPTPGTRKRFLPIWE